MILHDWQRGRIPFFVPPPKAEDKAEEGEAEVTVPGIDQEAIADNNQAAAALKAIAGIMSSQQQKDVPVQRDFYDEKDLKDDDKAKESTDIDEENETDGEEDEDEVSEDGEGSGNDSDEDVVSENEEENESDSAE